MYLIKKIILAVSLAMTVQISCFAEDSIRALSEGGVVLGGSAQPDKTLSVQVMKKTSQWLDENAWLSGLSGDIVYFGTVDTNAEGSYETDFYLPEPGEYVVYVSDNGGDIKKSTVKYVNAAENRELIKSINECTSKEEIYNILKKAESCNILMLDDSELYMRAFADTTEKDGTVPLEKISELILTSQKISEPYEFVKHMEKAALIVSLNGDMSVSETNIENYKNVIGLEENGLIKYYNPKNSTAITNIIKEKRISNETDFDTALRNAVVFANIEYGDSADNIMEMLKTFSDEIGISKSEVTVNAVKLIMGKRFRSLSDIKSFIKDNGKQTSKPNYSGGGSGSSGGGSSSGRGGIGGMEIGGGNKERNAAENTIEIFADLSSVPWAKEAVEVLYGKGIISGKDDDRFCPGDYITREEFTKLIVNTFSLNVVGNGMNFDDVNENDWFYKYVSSAYYAEIVQGISETHFGTGQNITRQDIAVMLCRGAEVSDTVIEKLSDTEDFRDAQTVSDYARESVKTLQNAGIVSGDDTMSFNPHAFATRAEAAKIIYGVYRIMQGGN